MNPGGFPERRSPGRPARIVLPIVLFLLLATVIAAAPPPPPPGPGRAEMRIAPILLDPADPARRDLGGLRFLGGWVLASGDSRFGGISAMHVEDGAVTALSDVGMVMRFALPGTPRTAPVDFRPLEAGPGPRSRKSNRDTEGMLVLGRATWVTFEHHNMIWRYRRDTLAALSSARPPAMRRWPGNAGAEGLVRLGDGRFLVFGEGRDNDRPLGPAVLFAGDPSLPATPSAALSYRRTPGYRASDAALLPDGRILLLSRRFSAWQGWSARLAVADPRGLGPGSVIEAREIAALQAPLTVDNMEALSVTREGARTIVWIASDDNFGAFQRTLLLKFELRA